jgi:hypothetical protein
MTTLTAVQTGFEVSPSINRHHPGITAGSSPQRRDSDAAALPEVTRSRPPLRRRALRDVAADRWPSLAHDDIMWRTGVRWDAEGSG